MTIDYEQLKSFVKEAMFTGGGINEPSAPEGIPHRMPAADTKEKEQDQGDPKANKMYEIALAAREATEELVEALDDPVFDGAYEHAFKASACLRKALNSLEESGAHPMPQQRVVSAPRLQQKFTAGSSFQSAMGDLGGGLGMPIAGALEEIEVPSTDELKAAGAENPSEVATALSAMKNLSEEDRKRVLSALALLGV